MAFWDGCSEHVLSSLRVSSQASSTCYCTLHLCASRLPPLCQCWNTNPTCLNDYRPVALTPIVMKCFERLVLAQLKMCLPPTLDPHQFANRSNRSTEDAVFTALHCVLSQQDNKNTYARMLFVDFSSAFNSVIPSTFITNLGSWNQ